MISGLKGLKASYSRMLIGKSPSIKSSSESKVQFKRPNLNEFGLLTKIL